MNQFTIEPYEIESLSQHEWDALAAIHNLMSAERDSLSVALPSAEFRISRTSQPTFVDGYFWKALDPSGSIIGDATLHVYTPEAGHNQHIGQFDISVLADHRRNGIGRKMLEAIVTKSKALNKTVIGTGTMSTVPAGAAFMSTMNADVAIGSITNQLDLANLDQDLLDQWISRASDRASDYVLLRIEGAYPDEIIDGMVDMHAVMNSAPTGDLQIDDVTMTADHLRQIESIIEQRGMTRWTFVVQNSTTGELAGYTEMMLNPNRPHIADQGDTAVAPEHRGKELGRWLKAAMLTHLLTSDSPAEYVRTGNASSNAPMLSINDALGFKPYLTSEIWQMLLDSEAA